MFKLPKKFFKRKKTAKNKEDQFLLVKSMPIQQPESSNAGEEESTVDFVMASGPDVEVSGERVLDILRTILSEQPNPEDFGKAAEVLKRWSKLNSVTTDKKEGNFPQNWLSEYLQEVDQLVENHIPTLPVEGAPGSQLQDFLKNTRGMIFHEVLRLTPVLEDTGLLVHLTDSYSRHLLTKLKLLLNRDLSVKDTFCLLQLGKDVFFSSGLKLTVFDPLLLTGWFERAKQKLLQELQKNISRTLQNILHYDEQHEHNEDSMDEETFIRLHIDVTQCLNHAILDAKPFGLTLMHAVQILCSEELQGFAQKYVDTENKRLIELKFTENNSLYPFRIINSCMELRCCATQISPDENPSNVVSSTISMLKELENKASSIVHKIMTCLAQANLKSYFKTNNVDIDNLMEAIQRQCASLPPNALKIKTIIVKIAYDCVSKVYLECLLKTKFRKLEKLWGNAEEKIKEDVQYFQETFSELNSDVVQENQLLQRMSEVLLHSDVDALKIICGELYRDFPHESEQYVAGLLRWKGVLSKRQVGEILDAIRDLSPSPNHSPNPCPNPSPNNRPIHSSNNSPNHSSNHSPNNSPNHSLNHSPNNSPNHSPNHSRVTCSLGLCSCPSWLQNRCL
ncbi:exocyst complex component 3-like protein isoform X2 [Pseudorasbora parva]|uniref:exocyst complex component 3-like protein isoform X2 n=1 Tax=Pseudorasbora parva TaxID=51549 RepID=UPI00351EA3ED